MISIVIPAFNEEKRILSSLGKITDFCKGFECEIIVVDDGSKDGTAKLVKNFSKKHRAVHLLQQPANMGKGAAVRAGMLAARGERILFSDADLSTPIEELSRFLRTKSDVVIASRALQDSKIMVHQPFYRELIGKTFNKIVQLFAVPGIWDTQCGFKLFSRNAAREIFPRTLIDGFGFDVEALFLACRLGFSVREIPVTWINSPESKVRPVRDSWRMFKDIFRIRWYSLTGRYGV